MKVSVAMPTYNHEKFIARAIESAVKQETDFEYEILIGEDCSPDGTREIVQEYAARYPHLIRAFCRESNLGSGPNSSAILADCRGEYIALLEGDDYWTSPHKLQKQVDFLDSHPECALCFHDVMVIYQDGSQESHSFCPPDQKEISTIEDLLVMNFIPTCSVMARNWLVDERPDWYWQITLRDWASHVLNAQHGDIGYVNDIMGAYRVHSGGVWSLQDPLKKVLDSIEVFEHLNAHLDYRYEGLIRTRISVAWGGAAGEMIERAAGPGEARTALAAVLSSYREWSRGSTMPAAWEAQILCHIYAGSFFASQEIHAPALTWHCFSKAAQYDPSWLRNWGVWSILLEASLGRRVAAHLRRTTRLAWRVSVE